MSAILVCFSTWADFYYDIGLQDGSDATIETLKVIEHAISKQAQILVEACSFTNTGNILKVQAMLHIATNTSRKRRKMLCSGIHSPSM